MSKLKRAEIKVWGTAYSVESARRLKALGADAVIVQSHEAGGDDPRVNRYEFLWILSASP